MIPKIPRSPRKKLSEPLNIIKDDEELIDDGNSKAEESEASDEESEASSMYQGLSSDEEDEDEEDPSDFDTWTGIADEKSELSTQFSTGTRNDPLKRILKNDSTLTRLEINLDRLRDWSIALPLEDVIQEIANQTSIKALKLNLEGVPSETLPDVFECVKKTVSVNLLVVQGAVFDRYTSRSLGTSVAENSDTIRNLTFDSCDFQGSSLAVLFLGVQHARNLTNLTIANCSLGGFASEIISASLPYFENLKFLTLRKTSIPLEGMRFLSSNLLLAKSIEELDLSENPLCTESVQLLARCLGDKDCKIKSLILKDCSLDSQSIEKLQKDVGKTSPLRKLDISMNPIGGNGASALISLLSRNNNIQKVDTTGCGIGKTKGKLLEDALRYNNSFLKNMFSSEVSLSILDSVGLVESLTPSFG